MKDKIKLTENTNIFPRSERVENFFFIKHYVDSKIQPRGCLGAGILNKDTNIKKDFINKQNEG